MDLKAQSKTAAGYPALDAFRLVAALLVVAIHTAPLASVSPTADFLLTRVVGRLAVPFFFMASGFFLARPTKGTRTPLPGFLRKIALLYGLCIVLYLPLNLYMGTFRQDHLAARLVQDVLWNGTAYHLWYFPAVLLGSCLAWWMHKHLRPGLALGLCSLLYLIGLLGDSWYGIASAIPGAKAFYGALFTVFEYTRNGLFFAPLFLWLGMWFAQRPRPLARPRVLTVGFGLALAALTAEALLLQAFSAPRHDSMYLLLPFGSVLLFALLVRRRGRARSRLRSLSTSIFILHPWCIVAVRGMAKVPGLGWVVDVSPVFYLCVCLCSAALALLLMRLPRLPGLPKPSGPRGGKGEKAPARAYTEVREDALLHNLNELRRLLPQGSQMMAVVKDDAYGHGALWVARRLQKNKVRAFAVATMEEGIALRKGGVWGTILVLGYTHPSAAGRLRRWGLTQTAVDLDHARALSQQGVPLRVHVKVDTGMHRLGTDAANAAAVREIYALPHLKVEGIFTHLARAGSPHPQDHSFTRKQTEAYFHLLEALARQGVKVGKTHLQSSYGLLYHPGLPCHYVRCGLALYGVPEHPGRPFPKGVSLRPVLSLRATVACVHTLPCGEWVGYGRTYQCSGPTRVATVTAGYGDGVPRAIEGGYVLLHGRRAPLLGRVSMDQLAVCVDGIPDAAPGDVATLIGPSGGEVIGAEDLAAWGGTIANEVLARIGSRVKEHCRALPASTPALPQATLTVAPPTLAAPAGEVREAAPSPLRSGAYRL